MKFMKILSVLFFAFILSGLLSSCANSGNTAPKHDTSAPATAAASPDSTLSPDSTPSSTPAVSPTPSTDPSPSQAVPSASGFTFEEKTYADGRVAIAYPQLTGMSDVAAQEKLNSLIAETALRDVATLENGTEYELNYKVTFNTPAVISMYFDGYVYVPGAAHPYQFLRAVTIDIAKQTTVPLQALVSVTEDLIDIVLNGKYSAMGYDMTSEYEASIRDYLAEMDEEFWSNELRNADMADSAAASFLTGDALVVSVSVPHVMGDHIEIYLSFAKLTGYQTDNVIWQEIENRR